MVFSILLYHLFRFSVKGKMLHVISQDKVNRAFVEIKLNTILPIRPLLLQEHVSEVTVFPRTVCFPYTNEWFYAGHLQIVPQG